MITSATRKNVIGKQKKDNAESHKEVREHKRKKEGQKPECVKTYPNTLQKKNQVKRIP